MTQKKNFSCEYFVSAEEDTFSNVHWKDICLGKYGSNCLLQASTKEAPCSLATGWMYGEDACKGWGALKSICQSPLEMNFLREYLLQNHDRESPMLIPQAYVGSTEHRRPDFIILVPETKYIWKRIAIQLDTQRYHSNLQQNNIRNVEIEAEGYEVVTFTERQRRIDQVRELRSYIKEIEGNTKL